MADVAEQLWELDGLSLADPLENYRYIAVAQESPRLDVQETHQVLHLDAPLPVAVDLPRIEALTLQLAAAELVGDL